MTGPTIELVGGPLDGQVLEWASGERLAPTLRWPTRAASVSANLDEDSAGGPPPPPAELIYVRRATSNARLFTKGRIVYDFAGDRA